MVTSSEVAKQVGHSEFIVVNVLDDDGDRLHET